MIRSKLLSPVCLLWPLLAPFSAFALTVNIQGIRLETQAAGSSCVEIAGSYPGVRIEPSQNGKTPRVCYNSNNVNTITVLDSTFVAAPPINKEVKVRFEHKFPTGINGKVMVRSKLQGFFSSQDGLAVPVGDKVSFLGVFGQSENYGETFAEPFERIVGEEVDSAVFEYMGKKQYLVAGPRSLEGELTLSFVKVGHRLTLIDKSGMSLDTGSTMADKLEMLEQIEKQEPTEEENTSEEVTLPPENQKPAAAPESKKVPTEPEGEKSPPPKKTKPKAPKESLPALPTDPAGTLFTAPPSP